MQEKAIPKCFAVCMPAVVQTCLDTGNLNEVMRVQKGIVQLYKKDIAKYDPGEKHYLEDIFQLIPSELNSKNKRFILHDLEYGKQGRTGKNNGK